MKKRRTRGADSKEAKEMQFLREKELMQAEATRILQEHFSEAQQDRYEAYRRSHLREGTVRKVMSAVTSLNMPKNTMVAVKGAAKLFVGELIEEARTVMDEQDEAGPIRPWHVREAYRRLQEEGKVPMEPAGIMTKPFSAKRNIV